MLEAARLHDDIKHTSALAGFLAGALLGCLVIIAAAVMLSGCGLVVGLVLGLLVMPAATKTAWGLAELGKSIGSMFSSVEGKLAEASKNVRINSLGAVRVELSTAACSKHAPQPQVAEGSGSVFINSKAAARVDDKLTCGAAIATGSTNVAIGGGQVRYLKVQDEVSQEWYDRVGTAFTVAEFVGGLAGAIKQGLTAGSRCAMKFAAGFVAGEALNHFVVAPAIDSLGKSIGGYFGYPVDVITGQKLLFEGEDNDFMLPAHLPLTGQRYYRSDLQTEGLLGKGWLSEWEQHLTFSQDAVIYHDAMGREVPFPRVGEAEKIYNYDEKKFITGLPDGRICICGSDDFYLIFSRPDENGKARLERIENRQGQWTQLIYQQDKLIAIKDSSHNTLRFVYIPSKNGIRLGSVWFIADKEPEEAHPLVSYIYTAEGQLTRVLDGQHQLQREFTYHEQRMTEQRLRSGLKITYQWALIGETFRIIETETSLGDKSRFVYSDAEKITTVYKENNTQAQWQYNEAQQVLVYTDFDGRAYQMAYNEQAELTAMTLPGGEVIGWKYDELGRVTAEIDPAGQQTQRYYHRNSFNLIRYELPDGSHWSTDYNDNGLASVYRDPLGNETHYGYNTAAELTTITDATGGVVKLSWNARGQLLSYLDCSGNLTAYNYTPLGQLDSVTDSLGQCTRYRYDKQGNLIQALYPDDTQEEWRWDSRGLLVRHIDAAGQIARWGYDTQGLLHSHTDRIGRQLIYQYDRNGLLTKLNNANGGQYQFRYDAIGRLLTELRIDGTSKHYRYNAQGQLARVIHRGDSQDNGVHPKAETLLAYNRTGMLSEKTTATAITAYQYNNVNALIAAEVIPTPEGVLRGVTPHLAQFTYDAAGQLLTEKGDAPLLEYSYDPLGNLDALRMPYGGSLQWLRYGSGHVSAIKFNQQMVTEFSRNAVYQEVTRTQGALTQYSRYDERGRLSWRGAQSAHHPEVTEPGQGKIWRRYGYSPTSNVLWAEDGLRGRESWQYDAEGRLKGHQAMRYGMLVDEVFTMDAADNLLNSHSNGQYRDNRLTQREGFFCEYDAWGNMTEKRQGNEQHYFAYDGEHRLIAAQGVGHQGRYKAHYHYDGLGRRIKKAVETRASAQQEPVMETTDFIWQGLRLLQERHQGECQTYLYDPLSPYTPLALARHYADTAEAARTATLYYYHTELNGAPLDVTNEAGQTVWSGEYKSWGAVKRQTLAFLMGAKGNGRIRQPLRYAGQYHDQETGLHYNTFRYYDPKIGRFTTQDPIGLAGGMNLYAYAPNPITWIDPWGLTPWEFGKFNEWFNAASVQDVINNKTSVSSALRGSGGKHELFPVSLAAKAKELGFTAEELKKYAVNTDRITFTNVSDSKGIPVPDGGHHGSRAGRHFHNKLIAELEGATSKADAKKIIARHHKGHMKLSGC